MGVAPGYRVGALARFPGAADCSSAALILPLAIDCRFASGSVVCMVGHRRSAIHTVSGGGSRRLFRRSALRNGSRDGLSDLAK